MYEQEQEEQGQGLSNGVYLDCEASWAKGALRHSSGTALWLVGILRLGRGDDCANNVRFVTTPTTETL